MVSGSGTPATVFAHGFAGSISETRPFASGVEGTRVFFHFRGHGETAAGSEPWSYVGLREELDAVRDAFRCRRGLGVSLGAGALLAAAVARPADFDRLVLVIPAAVDRPRDGRAVDRVDAMASAAESGDVDGLTALLLAEQGDAVRDRRVVQLWARQQAERMAGPSLVGVIRDIPLLAPLADKAALTRIDCPVLVVGHEADEAHPARLVDELVDALPDAIGKVYGPGGVLWAHRAELRADVTSFLNDSPDPRS